MKYLLLIYENEKNWESLSDAERAAVYKEYGAFGESITKSGNHIVSHELQPTTKATTLRVRGGKVQTTDGPFAETREQLGGFYLIDAKNLDEALGIAARIPSAKSGAIEVRPVVIRG